MKCQKCGINIANHHKITEINGERFEQHLCSGCARESGQEKLSLFNVGDIFNNFLEPFEVPQKRLYCEDCLTTFDEFLNTGFVGCEHCYDYFKEQMKSVLKDMQAGETHKPRRLNNVNINTNPTQNVDEKESLIISLQEKIKQAVSEERYEDAAKYKKQLDEIKGEK